MFSLLAQAQPQVSIWYEVTSWALIAAALLLFVFTARRDIYNIFFGFKKAGSAINLPLRFLDVTAILASCAIVIAWLAIASAHMRGAAWLDFLAIVAAIYVLIRFAARSMDPDTGLRRIWAVARTAIFEALAVRIWIVLPIWFIAILIVNALVVPFDDVTDTVSLYASVCLYGQMFMVLLSLMVLACFSCGKERERRTIITTGSKPLSRLEFFLGKIVGFSTVGLVLLAIMGSITYVYLANVERSVRADARAKYAIQQEDYEKAHSGMNAANSQNVAVNPPSQALKNIGDSGVLVARNYVAAKQFQVAGLIAHTKNGNVRYLKGGSGSERMILRFPTIYTTNYPPMFIFRFVPYFLRNVAQDELAALKIKLRVSIGPIAGGPPDRNTEATIDLVPSQANPGLFVGTLTPDLPLLWVPANHPETQSIVKVEVSCGTAGIYLGVMENTDNNDWNVAVMRDPAADWVLPSRAPFIVGNEKYDKQQIEGPREGYVAGSNMFNDGEVASFRFSAAEMKTVPRDADGNATLSMYLDVDKRDKNSVQSKVDVEVYDARGASTPVLVSNQPVNEKILTEVKLPLKDIQPDNDIFVDIRCAVPTHWISLVNDSVRFELPPSLFIVNLMKSEMVIFFSVVLLVTVSVVASVRVNGWVAMLVALMAYFLGAAIPMLQDYITGGMSNLLTPSDLEKANSFWLYKGLLLLQELSIKIVYVIAQLLPDFRRFDPTTDILQYRNMPWTVLGTDCLWMIIFAAPMIAVGYLMIRKQELA